MNRYYHKNTISFVRARIVAAVSLFLMFGTIVGDAAIFESGNNLRISQLQNIPDDLYVFGGETATIDGSIEGDFSAIAVAELFMRGEVGQSVNVAVRSVTSTGTIQGSFRAFAESVHIDGYIGGSALIFAKTITFESESVVERSVNLVAQSVTINGSIKGKADIRAEEVVITGLIVGDLIIKAKKIIIAPPAIIRGNLDYTSDNEIQIDTSNGVTIVGNVAWHIPDESTGEDAESNYLKTFTLSLATLLAAFLFGIIMLKLFKPYVEASFIEARDNLSVSFATGSVALIGLVVCLVILSLSGLLLLFGLRLLGGDYSPIGLMMMIVSILMVPITSFGAVSGGIIFYSGKIVLGFLIGYLVLGKFSGRAESIGYRHLILGLLILSILFEIPFFVGFLVYLMATITGAGAIILGIRKCYCDPRQLQPITESDKPDLTPDNPTTSQ